MPFDENLQSKQSILSFLTAFTNNSQYSGSISLANSNLLQYLFELHKKDKCHNLFF